MERALHLNQAMKHLNFLVLLVSIQFIAISHAYSKTVEDVLTEIILPHARPIGTEKKFYHYFYDPLKDSEMATFEKRQKFINNRASSLMSYFWQPDMGNTDAAGPGLYAALDPWSSSSYGNIVVEISIIDNKFKYLDLAELMDQFKEKKNINSIESSTSHPEMKKRIIQMFEANDPNAFAIFLQNTEGISEKIEIRRMLISILKKMNIVAFQYWYPTGLPRSYCQKIRNDNALVFFGQIDGRKPIQVDLSAFKLNAYSKDFQNLTDQEIENTDLLNKKIVALKNYTFYKEYNSKVYDTLRKSTLGCDEVVQ